MPTHTITSREKGDEAITFDSADPVAVEKAMERFNDLVKNHSMWAVAPGKDGAPGRHVTAFEPDTDLVFNRQLIGG